MPLQKVKAGSISHLIDEIERISQKLNIGAGFEAPTEQERQFLTQICTSIEQPVSKRKRKG